MSIESISGTEHTEWVEPAEFSGTIASFASDRKEAAKEARQHMDGPDWQLFWTDGLYLYTGRAVESVAWRQTER